MSLFNEAAKITAFEWLGFFTAIASVWLTARQQISGWAFSIASSFFYLVVFYAGKLYSDTLLQCIFIIMGFYGIVKWRGRGGMLPEKIKNLTWRSGIASGLIIFFGTAMQGYLLHRFTAASLPYLDSLCTMISLVATGLAARKVLQQWLLWIFVDTLYVGIYLYKGLYLTSFLYAIFIVLAVRGYALWKRS